MIVVRDVFTAKPGMATKLAKMMKEATNGFDGGKVRVLTDLVGGYNTVVMETEFPNLEGFEKRTKEYMEKPDMRQKMAGYTDLWLTGHREILRVTE
jgi:hypothetical protein